MRRQDSIAALSVLAAARRDADLGRLAGVSARLSDAVDARDRLEEALAGETAQARQAPDLPVLQALDAHMLLAERARAALDAQITRLAAERETQRRLCTSSFGRADVLERLRARQQALRRVAE